MDNNGTLIEGKILTCEKGYTLTLLLLLANLTNTKWCKKLVKLTETIANGYSSESTQQELSNEYQHNKVSMVLKNLCIFVLWTKVALALEGITIQQEQWVYSHRCTGTNISTCPLAMASKKCCWASRNHNLLASILHHQTLNILSVSCLLKNLKSRSKGKQI